MKKIISMILLFSLSIVFLGCQENTIENPNEQYCQITSVDGVYKCTKGYFAFDTTVSFTLYYDAFSDYDIDTVYNQVNDILIEYDQLLDPYDPVDGINNLYTINHSETAVEVSETLFNAIEYAINHQDFNPDSDELLFNIALGPIINIWHDARYSDSCESGLLYDRCPVPSEDVLNQPYNTNPDDVILDKENLTIGFKKDNMMLDLGGFAKGYISMIIEEQLAVYDMNYIMNMGASNVLVVGDNTSNTSGNDYRIGLTRPEFDTIGSENYGIVQIEDGYSAVSSGSYQRYFKNLDREDPTYYHHIIDPRTNMPGGEAMAVTIITTQTGLSDILSTAIFLMSYEEGLAYVNSVEDLEAIWYFSEDDIRMSENFEDFFVLL
jgi:thiamine biosynthesis lipoprotein